jgi:hypothetical protein
MLDRCWAKKLGVAGEFFRGLMFPTHEAVES